MEERSSWTARGRGSAAAALGMWGNLLLLLLVLMVLDPAGWALDVPLLCTLTRPPALSDSSDMKKAKYVPSNLENRFPVQTVRLRQNTAYLHGRDRGRETVAVNHSIALSFMLYGSMYRSSLPACLGPRPQEHSAV